MFKNLLILLLSIFLLFSCSKKNNTKIISEPTDEEKAVSIYIEALVALKKGDAFYACLLYTSPSPRDKRQSRMPSSA